ncbi:efflux RND transporter permease subunit [Mangrovibacterium lignilyticum]|uniref:efflux RND transporter permease subunit n=1 Tax=Mangrovibacterium lignilyticum TaxID=2668052 RepID=UPI0013D6073B|nr:efflux RND transporter permease subunit [Mangrovibacterium lignilyticum]
MSKDKEKQADNSQHITRKFKPTYLAIKNKTTVYILTALLVFAGIFSYNKMPRELFPEIVIPTIFVQTIYPGNSPVDIENFITRPIEKELKGLQGVKKVSSASYQDVSIIIVEFNTGVEVKQALQDVKDRVDKSKTELPNDLDIEPLVQDLDFSAFPIMNVNLSGDFSLRDLRKFAETLQDEFEGLNEISEATLKGVDEREIQINVDPYKLEASGLTFQDVATAIQMENLTMGAGEFTSDEIRRVIRTQADYTNMNQIANTIIKVNSGKPVYIRDVANVVDGYKERSTESRLDEKPVVTLSITKKSGENILAATDKVSELIKEHQKSGYLPANLDVRITDDNSLYIRNQIANLENSIILGMLLVIFVLFLFLGFRNALFSGLSIPMSMFLSFVILQQMGISLNNMVLFSLILALGMLVDNSIVVVENVYRLHSQGYSALTATKRGVSEIAFPIISSTLTTLAAFFPLIFWEGIMGEFMKILPETLIIVLASSLFVALVLTPPFIAGFMKIEDIDRKANVKRILRNAGIIVLLSLPFYFLRVFWFANILALVALLMILNAIALRGLARWFQNKFLVWLENFYEKQLKFAITGKKPLVYFTGTVLLMFLSIGFYYTTNPELVFFPSTEPQTIFVTSELPLGSSIEKTDQLTRKVEEIVKETLEPYQDIVKSVTTNVGSGKGTMFESSSSSSPNKSLISISFEEFKLRHGINTTDIMALLSKNLKGFVGAKVYVEKQDDGPPVGAPINIEVSGDKFDQLLKITDEVIQQIDADRIPGIEGLKLDINTSQPEMLVKINREKARLYELSTSQIGLALRHALYGYDVGDYKDGEDEYDIFIRLDEKYRNDVSTLMNQKIISEGNKIPISAVASFEYSTTYDKINRINNKRTITVSSNVLEGYNANEINARIRQVLSNYELPRGYTLKFTGEQEEQAESSNFLIMALLIALASITLILVTQFNSFIRPLIIMTTVLFSTIGVFLGLGIFHMEFVVIMTGIGIISLAGIVVNNGIVLVDYIDLLRKRRREELGLSEKAFLSIHDEVECIVHAGKTRLRPVLLTAITTVLGLIPLAVGLNFDFFTLFTDFKPDFSVGGETVAFWGPMSWTVIFGLTFATFLTLIISPVMYMLTIRINYRVKKLLGMLPEDSLRDKAEIEE